MFDLEILTTGYNGLFTGLILGYLISLIPNKRKNPAKGCSHNTDDLKLKNEVLNDKVKQLEAQNKTLEKALDKAIKS